MRVLVCGSRDFEDQAAVCEYLDGVHDRSSVREAFVLIEGGADGADRYAREWSYLNLSDPDLLVTMKADWESHGKAAGPLRNQRMLDEGKPRLVLAFVNKPLDSSKGTRDMVTRARNAGVPVRVIECLS